MIYFLRDANDLYRNANRLFVPRDRNLDSLLSRVLATATEAIFAGLTAGVMYSVEPTLVSPVLSEYSFILIGVAFGTVMSVTKHYLDCKIDQYSLLTKIQFAASRVFTVMSSFATVYLVAKIAGFVFGVNIASEMLMVSVLFSPIVGTIVVYEVIKRNYVNIVIALFVKATIETVLKANRDSILFAPAIPLP